VDELWNSVEHTPGLLPRGSLPRLDH